MKKMVIVSAIALLAFASCKKEYACECTDLTTFTVSEKTGKGKDGTKACNDVENKVLGIHTEVCTPK